MTDDSPATRLMSDVRTTTITAGAVLRQRYRLESEIGRGGMGIVYRATDLELMREVAVKILPETSSSPDARQRLIREARAAAALNLPHIISVHDVGEAEGVPFFVMELVHGPSLSQARPAEFTRIVDIATQICAPLEHAHANSIIHRDLKPENVLLSAATQSGSVKLADLGLALPSYAARKLLGEDAFNRGEHDVALEHAEHEREIALKLHSRERRAWTYLVTSMSSWYAEDWKRAEEEFREGISLSESIGELRLALLLKGNLATFLADRATTSRHDQPLNGNPLQEGVTLQSLERERLLEEALQIALENFSQAETLGLLYSRAEARRCLAHVRFRRNELDEAERLCSEARTLVSDTESRVSRLWLGPLYIQVLRALSERAAANGNSEEALAKRAEAADHLARYSNLVAACQSQRFTREAKRLAGVLGES